MPKTARRTYTTELICPKCGNFSQIQRIITRKRGITHIKPLYCPVCKKRTRQIEILDRKLAIMEIESYEERTKYGEYLLNLLTRNDCVEEEKQDNDDIGPRYTLSRKVWRP